MTMVDPTLPAAGSLTPVGLTSPPLDDDREIIPKNAANITYDGMTPRQLAWFTDATFHSNAWLLYHCCTDRLAQRHLSLNHTRLGPGHKWDAF